MVMKVMVIALIVVCCVDARTRQKRQTAMELENDDLADTNSSRTTDGNETESTTQEEISENLSKFFENASSLVEDDVDFKAPPTNDIGKINIAEETNSNGTRSTAAADAEDEDDGVVIEAAQLRLVHTEEKETDVALEEFLELDKVRDIQVSNTSSVIEQLQVTIAVPSRQLNDVCTFNLCRNNAKCVVVNQTDYKCVCGYGYIGEFCERLAVPCRPNPCQHGGTCNRHGKSGTEYICTCRFGFKGAACENIDNPCKPNPCKHGGHCNRLDDPEILTPYQCTCRHDYKGVNCEYPNIPCIPNPCQNGGECSNIRTLISYYYRCRCPTGFTGKTCETRTDKPQLIDYDPYNPMGLTDNVILGSTFHLEEPRRALIRKYIPNPFTP